MGRPFYRLLLHCYPPAFRQRFGDELLFAFEAGLDAAARRGPRAAAAFLTASTADAVMNGARERRSNRWYSPRARRDPLMKTVFADIKYGMRLLLRNPAFALLAIATLALGIGLTAAIFSIANDVLLRRLPYPDEARVVRFWEYAPSKDILKGSGTPANFLDWRARSTLFSHVGGLAPYMATVGGDAGPVRMDGRRVTAAVFDALGVEPLLGRLFGSDDERQGNNVVVLSHRTWQQQFGADPAIVGRSILLNETRRIVIGVLRPDFRLPGEADSVFIPWVFSPFEVRARKSHFVTVVARLRDGSSLAQGQEEMTRLAEQLAAEYPDANKGEGILVEPIRESFVGDVRSAILMLAGAVTLVLLIACVNVANLLLARASGRGREMAVRAALGASRVRLVRQLLTESVLLAAIAGGAGIVVAYWCMEALRVVVPPSLAAAGDLRLNPIVAGAAVALCSATGLLFGLAPALQLSRRPSTDAIREGRQTASRRSTLLRQALVTVQVSLAIVLLAGSGLLMRSFLRLASVDPGFSPDSLLTLTIQLPPGRYEGPEQWQTYFEQAISELRGIPGVRNAAAVSWLPLTSDGGSNAIFIEGRPLPGPNENTYAIYRLVTPGYFGTIGIPVIDGRDFTVDDRIGGTRVGAINQTLAARMWPGERAVGKRLTFSPKPKPADWITVVAVVGDTHHGSLADPVDIQLYAPYTQEPNWFPPSDIVIRTSVEPASIAAVVRGRLQHVDPLVPIANLQTMERLITGTLAEPRFHMVLVAGLGLSALALATIGVYGLLAFTVAMRAREIGVRAALGATPSTIARMVAAEGMRMAGVGVAVGLVAAFVAVQSMHTLLFQIEPTDPATFAGIAVLLLAVTAAASYIPARRAARLDPLIALRKD
jgi:putative ABC transport system permease protein